MNGNHYGAGGLALREIKSSSRLPVYSQTGRAFSAPIDTAASAGKPPRDGRGWAAVGRLRKNHVKVYALATTGTASDFQRYPANE